MFQENYSLFFGVWEQNVCFCIGSPSIHPRSSGPLNGSPQWDTFDLKCSVSDYKVLSLFCKVYFGSGGWFLERVWAICLPYLKLTLLTSPLKTGHRIGLSFNFKPFGDLGLEPVIFGHVVTAPCWGMHVCHHWIPVSLDGNLIRGQKYKKLPAHQALRAICWFWWSFGLQ